MPFFQYQASDKSGDPVQGTVQAGSLDEANLALTRQGYRVHQIGNPGAPATAAPPVVQAPTHRAPVVSMPIEQSFQRSSALSPARPGPAQQEPFRKTRYSTEADLYFLFNQLASYFKSGINPAQAFKEVGDKQRRADFKECLHLVAARSGEGQSIADTLALYPYLFPPHAVGTVRAGETGGYLPEAMDTIAAQADSSRKMRRWMVWLGWFAIGIPPVIPIGRALFNSVLASWAVQDASGGTAPVGSTIWNGFVKELSGPLGIFSVIILVVFVVGAFAWQSMAFRRLRHWLTLIVPTIGKRASAESMAAFTWNLSNLSRAGISPRQSYLLATETVPNLHIKEAMLEQGRQMTDQTKLSDALHNTKMLPYELTMMVQTGEVTGDVAGQLMNGAVAQREEFDHQSKNLVQRVGCWMALLFFLVGPLVVIWLYRDFLLGLISTLTSG